MTYLNNEELMNISGGALKLGALAGIAGIVLFLIGVIDGVTRPLKCR